MIYATIYSCMMEERIIPIHEQIVQLNIYWIHMREHTWWKPQPSCVIFTNHLDSFLAWNLLFLYITNGIEFAQDILQDCVSSYHLYVWFFGEFRRLFCRGLHWFSRSCDFHKIHSHFKMVPLKFDMEFRPEARFCSLLYNCMSLLYAPRGKRVPQLERCKWPNITSNIVMGLQG